MIEMINYFITILVGVVIVLGCTCLIYDILVGNNIIENPSWIDRYYNKQYIYQNSEVICKSHPPEECTDEELKWIMDNTMHYWNIDHCIEYNKRKNGELK